MSNLFQKIIFLTILFYSSFNYSFAQTFINSPIYPSYATVYHDTINVGPLSFSSTNDNYVWALVKVSQDENTHIVKYDSMGVTLVDLQITSPWTLSTMRTTDVLSCPDNGCVFATTRYYGPPDVEAKAYRLNDSGIVMWTRTFNHNTCSNPTPILSIKPIIIVQSFNFKIQ